MGPPARPGLRHVALAYPVAVPWMALFARGVAEYAQAHGGWTFTTSPPTLNGAEEFALDIRSLVGWPGDGVIAAISSPAEVRAAKALGIPVVNLSGAMAQSGLPRVMVDHHAIGRVAAEHLLQRGLRRMAFYGMPDLEFSKQRRQGFCQRLKAEGVECSVFESPVLPAARLSWNEQMAPLDAWLRNLKPPLGIFAVQDYRARVLVDECLRLGLRVPHDVAVIGVDNDPTICELWSPMLTSVSRSAWRVGYETAALLDRLMAGAAAPRKDILIPPDGVVQRQSTDTVAVEDQHVAAAVHFIHDHLGQRYGIEHVVRAAGISRRQLELRFRRALGCTPYAYVCRTRVERAKHLLAGARMKMRHVAGACGFASPERFRLIFRRATGSTPLEYRRSIEARKRDY